jgi:bifunctional ADP-heptose synthase (sugar kinase/adenylyltransferase)
MGLTRGNLFFFKLSVLSVAFKLKTKQMKTGITFSAFDLLHAGHVKMLEKLNFIVII